jgi:hypothetical protein
MATSENSLLEDTSYLSTRKTLHVLSSGVFSEYAMTENGDILTHPLPSLTCEGVRPTLWTIVEGDKQDRILRGCEGDILSWVESDSTGWDEASEEDREQILQMEDGGLRMILTNCIYEKNGWYTQEWQDKNPELNEMCCVYAEVISIKHIFLPDSEV